MRLPLVYIGQQHLNWPGSQAEMTCVCRFWIFLENPVVLPQLSWPPSCATIASRRASESLFNLFWVFYVKNGPNPASFCLFFVLFSHCKDKYSTNLTINDKCIDGVLGSQTRGGRIVSAEESTELFWGFYKEAIPGILLILFSLFFNQTI